MKTKKKLSLSKKTISNLSEIQMSKIAGVGATAYSCLCLSEAVYVTCDTEELCTTVHTQW